MMWLQGTGALTAIRLPTRLTSCCVPLTSQSNGSTDHFFIENA